MIWFNAQTTFARAKYEAPFNILITMHRTEEFTRMAQDLMVSLGFPIVDAANLTRSRWEAPFDGLHYAANIGMDQWGSQVASMMYQLVMNAIFRNCTGSAQ